MKKLFPLIGILFIATGCSKTDNITVNSNNAELHLSFTTPDWNRYINCDKLDLFPTYINDSTAYVSASSASTLETFCFAIPKDSSTMIKQSNLKKYAIKNYFENSSAFQFSQKLPLTDGSSARLVSIDSVSANSYNEVTAIDYVLSETNYCVFKVKCNYAMYTKEIGNTNNIKPVSGSFYLKVRTSKK